jgi:NPCBM/NEW2 domain
MIESKPANPNWQRLSLLLPVLFLLVVQFVVALPLDAAVIYCSDLTAVSATSGWSSVQKDMSIDKKPITLMGKVYPKGLGTHAPSEIVYSLNGKYQTFSADVGIDDETAGKGSVEFQVYADDSLLFKSGVIKGNSIVKKISVVIIGKNKLKLVTTIGTDTYDMDDADWAGAQLVEKEAVAILPGKRLEAFRNVPIRNTGFAVAVPGIVIRDLNGRAASRLNLKRESSKRSKPE